MNIFLPIHQETLRALNKYKVKYLLVGGYAVIKYGYHRSTGDLDLWICPSNEERDKLALAFNDMGYLKEDVEKLKTLDFQKAVVFSIGEEPDRIDFMTKVSMLKFNEAYKKRRLETIEDDLVLPFISYRDLIASKINTNRLKDKADIEELQKINKNRRQK